MKQNNPKYTIARRVAKEFKNNDIVNIGAGIPSLVTKYISSNAKVWLLTENGALGIGPLPSSEQENPNIIDTARNFTSLLPGGCYLDSSTIFGIIRGGHIDISVIEALQVDQQGNFANWIIPGKLVPGIGGSMDSSIGAKKVIIATEHNSVDGSQKILDYCTLPITGTRNVDLIITELAVIKVTSTGLVLNEISEETTINEVQNRTGAKLRISPKLKTF